MRSCRVPGCTAPATRWGTLCSTHKSHQRRHGDPTQEGVTKAELLPYLAVVHQRRAKNPNSPVWGNIESRWFTLVDHCRRVADAYLGGKATNRHERQACQEVVKLAEHVAASEVVDTALALYLMHEQAPRRFRSDDAFRCQLVRRLRGLTDVNAGTWFDHGTGKVKRVYRDLPANTSVVMGTMLAEVFGVVGLLLARKEQEDAEKRRRENEELVKGISELE